MHSLCCCHWSRHHRRHCPSIKQKLLLSWFWWSMLEQWGKDIMSDSMNKSIRWMEIRAQTCIQRALTCRQLLTTGAERQPTEASLLSLCSSFNIIDNLCSNVRWIPFGLKDIAFESKRVMCLVWKKRNERKGIDIKD